MKAGVNPQRVRTIKEGPDRPGTVVYWMSRDQRAQDNWAFLYAQQRAEERRQGLAVMFCLRPAFLDATRRHYEFMLKGLQEVEKELRRHKVPFFLLAGEAEKLVPRFVKDVGAGLLVTDFSPLRICRQWKAAVAEKINIPLYEVDAQSNLSPYLHFGQLAAQRVALATRPYARRQESRRAFLEELILNDHLKREDGQ